MVELELKYCCRY